MAGLALHPDPAAVIFDDLLANWQAQSRAFRLVGQRIANLFKLLKDFGLIGGGNANAGVLHAHNHFISLLVHRTRDSNLRQ